MALDIHDPLTMMVAIERGMHIKRAPKDGSSEQWHHAECLRYVLERVPFEWLLETHTITGHKETKHTVCVNCGKFL